jgi:sulfonate transport system permease protein
MSIAALKQWPAQRLAAVLSPLLLVALWHFATAAGWAPAQLLAPPASVIDAFKELVEQGELQNHLSASLHRLALGFVIGALAGLAYGILLGIVRPLETYTAPFFNAVRHVPTIAMIPVFILIFGIGETFKILIVVKASFFPVALAAHEAVKGIPRAYFDIARLYRIPPVQMVRWIVLPATVPPILTGMRLGLGRSWGILVAAELLAAESGIGQMMDLGRQMFRLDVVMVGVIITGLIGFTLDRGLKLIERRLVRWRPAHHE